ncbi:MAG: bifunctional transaldolase/phosoglucose isomerase [Pyrinomonadaceae bacterium]
MSRSPVSQTESPGRYQSLFEDALRRVEREQMVRRIWSKDAALWKEEEAHQKIIRNSLGWLTVAREMSAHVRELESFADEIRESGFTHLMLLGMGGSSLCPEVFRRTFGQREGFPQLHVLDTTDPDTIAAFESEIDLERTLFIVSSKSGTTIEPLSFYKYFFERVRQLKGERAGENFIAITDPGTLMNRQAEAAGFRKIFLNPADIGGRYSALSFFGLVPAALMGLDVSELLTRAVAAVDACANESNAEENPGVRLGALLGALALEGRDKLTLVAGGELASLGLWIEQLVAESTGKEGKGIVPIAGEPLAAPEAYGDDRLFVLIHTGGLEEELDRKARALESAGHPLVRRRLGDALDLCAEFFIWEFATAVAGAFLEINPFDQPNVQESKDNTNKLLDGFKQNGALPQPKALAEDGELRVYSTVKDEQTASVHSSHWMHSEGMTWSSPDTAESSTASPSSNITPASVITEHIGSIKTGDYVALLAYIQETDEHDEMLQAIRTHLRDRLHVATTTGYGPRFLHSTGQLHKGGPDSGVFIQLTDDDTVDREIPSEPYTFSTLKQAQALGDFSSLESHSRRALRVHLGSNAEAGLRKLLDIVREATEGN